MEKEKTVETQLECVAFDSPEGIVFANLKDRSNDPYIVKKVNKATETLKRVGFPAELLRIQAERMKQGNVKMG